MSATALQHRRDPALFALTASPDGRIDECVRLILQTAVDATGADAGGAILISGPVSGKNFVELLPLHSTPLRPRTELLRECDTICRSAVERENGMLFVDGHSVLRASIRQHDKVIGVIQVESLRPGAFSGSDSHRLGDLAYDAGIIISRLLLREYAAGHGFDVNLVGGSPRLLEIERQIQVAASDPKSPVLVFGERGSGKELAAYAVHYFSERRNGPFLPVNSAAFADTLLTDELFGHEKHSFTGAETSRAGIFKAAEGGTLFFDEIGDMAPPVQASLLRVLDHGELRRIGGDKPVKVDVRVICATNRDLRAMAANGSFRADLYDRLNVFRVEMPSLRDRKEDIHLLASYFLKKICFSYGRHRQDGAPGTCRSCLRMAEAACISADFYQKLSEYNFPGNVRELRNVITRVASDLPREKLGSEDARQALLPSPDDGGCAPEEMGLNAVIRNHIRKVLQITANNKSQAARMLGLPLTTLVNKMKKLRM